MTNEAKERAIRWLTEEVRSLRLAPSVNGCKPDNWAEQLEVMETCLEAFSAITDLIARAEAAEDRAEKAEMERRELASLCGKLIVLCEQPRELMEQLFMRNRGRMIGDYMGSGYPFVDAFNRIYVDFEETASDEAYKAVREATEVEAQKRGQKEE